MNCEEARDILRLYRPENAADEQDPSIVGALALAKQDPGLAAWLETHRASQQALAEKFRAIPVPAGLKEQIISENAAARRATQSRRRAVFAVALVVIMGFTFAAVWLSQRRPAEDTLAVFQNRMAKYALRGYSMDTNTSDAQAIRAYLKQRQAPADYVLTAPLQQTAQSGCAVEGWLDKNVTMVCFLTGRPLAAGAKSDLWLFVVDQKSVQQAPVDSVPHFARVNRLVTATWVRDGRLYFLALEGEPDELKKYL